MNCGQDNRVHGELKRLWDETLPPGGWDPLRVRMHAAGRGKGHATGRRGWIVYGLPIAAAALAFSWMAWQMTELRTRVAELSRGPAAANGFHVAGTTGGAGEPSVTGGTRGVSLPPRSDLAEQAREFLALYRETQGFHGRETRWVAVVEGQDEVFFGQASNGAAARPAAPLFVQVELAADGGSDGPSVLAQVALVPGSTATFCRNLAAGRVLQFRLEAGRSDGAAELRAQVECRSPNESAVLSSLAGRATLRPDQPRTIGSMTIENRLYHVILTTLKASGRDNGPGTGV